MDTIVRKGILMGKVTIMPATVKQPLSFMGECAGPAYGSDTSSPEKNYKRGLTCVKDGHGRLLEFCDVFLKIEGYSARVMREFMRHVGDGLTAIQRSTRYCSEENFEYYTPPYIEKNLELKSNYDKIMNHIQEAYSELVTNGVAKEDAANILPLGMTTMVVMKKNARCLSDMAQVRLCNRAYVEYRQLMKDIIQALRAYSPEWNTLADEIFKCKCDRVGFCEEKFSCGRYPKKEIDN